MTTYFDERAKDWDAKLERVERAQAVADAIQAAVDIRPGMTALEYGCGTGLLSFFLQDAFASITLADTSQGMLEVLADKIKAAKTAHMHPVRLDLAVDPLPAQKFDITYSLMVMHHIPNTDVILHKFHEILKPGGWLVVADLDQEDGSFHTDGSTDVHLGFARDKLQKRVEAAGFIEVRFSTAHMIEKLIDNQQRTFPVFLMTARSKV
jgi:ubiquinone/menaquinone biosynthesis C-methylase UbiE